MNDFEELFKNADRQINDLEQRTQKNTKEIIRAHDVVVNTNSIMADLDDEFSKKTSLNFSDFGFLFFATALQLARIILINKLTKIEKAGSENQIEKWLHEKQKNVLGVFDGYGNNTPYFASMDHIITTKGVPYDATKYANVNYGFFKGANHRFATLGHDPLIGLVIGTSNIITNTITCRSHEFFSLPITCHVGYDANGKNPVITDIGSSSVMLSRVADRICDDPKVLAAALIKQIIHIATDTFTTCGIEIPGANLILSNKQAEELTKYINFGDIIKATTSMKIQALINVFISTLHMLTCDSVAVRDRELHSVKTMKILEYSNVIATGSHTIYKLVEMYLTKNPKALREIDWGGMLGTIMLIISDQEVKRRIKEEFIYGSFEKMLMGEDTQLLSD
ncbi:hypothetical protein [Anaerovibrio lipolyticus]|uniref:hypothetical protein n=1 Tax=Anaerovibrio lipolyticus TaxID=82374 RepID=UPI00047F889F|nr:hypothetical protein [Anaerovibrio lipolyticus]